MLETMNTTVKCVKCHGTKRINGMGGMQRDCDKCNGVGFLKDTTIKSPSISNVVPQIVGNRATTLNANDLLTRVKGKPGRKPKSQLVSTTPTIL